MNEVVRIRRLALWRPFGAERVHLRRELRMTGSRMAWAGSAVAPWGIALGLLVSITARADPDSGVSGGPVERNGGVDRFSPVHEALSAATFRASAADSAGGADAWLIPAHLTLGTLDELSAIPDEIEPKSAFKRAGAEIPTINREHKGDPFIVLRPGLGARGSGPAPSALVLANSEADWPADSRSPVALAPAADNAPSRPTESFSDGATPSIALDWALNSSTPGPSEGKLLIGAGHGPAQTTIAAKLDYASLIDPKDSARQMRCLAEAVYFESRSEPENGQAAVAQVVLNRVRSGIFPTNVCGVVYQDRNRPFACQFSFACEGKSLRIEEPDAWATATRIAEAVVTGVSYDPKLADAVNYHAAYVYPFWAPSLKRVERIGAHIFYAMRPGLNWAPGALNGRGDLPPLQATAAK